MYGYPAQEPPDVLASGQRAPAAPARVPGRAEPVIVSIRAARPALGHVIQADGAGRRHCEAHASRAEMAQVHLAHPFIDPHNTASLPSRRLSSRRTFAGPALAEVCRSIEVVDGAVAVRLAPTREHQDITLRLANVLDEARPPHLHVSIGVDLRLAAVGIAWYWRGSIRPRER